MEKTPDWGRSTRDQIRDPWDESRTLALSRVSYIARGESNSDLVLRIAKAFDAALATGRYDAAFLKPATAP